MAIESFHLSMSTTTGTSDSKVLDVVLLARQSDREGTFYYIMYRRASYMIIKMGTAITALGNVDDVLFQLFLGTKRFLAPGIPA